jgi:hypothetical protein
MNDISVPSLGEVRGTPRGRTLLDMSTGLEQGGIRGANGAWWGVLSPPRMGTTTLEAYAEAVACRERILDEAGIRRRVDVVVGDVDGAWQKLREHAVRFGTPLLEGDFEKSNRITDWDQRILNDAAIQDAWRVAYPRALVRACSIDPDEEAGRSAAAHLEQQPSLLWNAFVPLHMRRPGLTEELRAHARRVSSLPPSAPRPTPVPSSAPADVTVFPGDKLPNLSDFARLQSAIQATDFMSALYREGLDPIAYARLSDRWAKRLAADPALRAEYATVLRRESAMATVRETVPIPHPDSLVFPGQPLARVSDFARISRAAKRGDFRKALARAGIDRDKFATLCARFNDKMKADAALARRNTHQLDHARGVKHTDAVAPSATVTDAGA